MIALAPFFLKTVVLLVCLNGKANSFVSIGDPFAKQILFQQHNNNHVFWRRSMVADPPDSTVEELTTEALLDQILDEGLRTSARRPIIMEFDPSSRSIWKHWKGTIFAETWQSAVRHMIFSAMVYFFFLKVPKARTSLSGFFHLWNQTLAICTFTLSFFVNEAYSLWRTCLTISRTLQGRLNDLMMGLVTHAKRVDPKSPEDCSTFAPGSRQLCMIVSRYIRLFHLLCYSSFTRSYRPLLTPRGMRRLVERGLLTRKEREVLVRAPVAATQRFNVVLTWIARSVIEGRAADLIVSTPAFEPQTLQKVCEIRAQAMSMESVLRGRMPFAYAHVVQVLVDGVLWMYPIGAFTHGVSLQIGLLGTALLTMSYQGLFNLAKRFLDPYHNENFWSGDDALVVDTLIAESNAGSLRWVYGFDEMPIPSMTFTSANFESYILPDEGFTKQEATKRTEEEVKEDSMNSKHTEMTQEEVARKAAEILEAAEEEYEETKLILKAPPGSDFVPGLDDNGNNDVVEGDPGSTATSPSGYPMGLDLTDQPPGVVIENDKAIMNKKGRFQNFVEAAGEEFLKNGGPRP